MTAVVMAVAVMPLAAVMPRAAAMPLAAVTPPSPVADTVIAIFWFAPQWPWIAQIK